MANRMYTLVVDDEAEIRFFLEETLRKDGHHVTTVEDGEKAQDLLRETFFDLVMLDLNLGGRVDGLRVLEAVKWRWPRTLVIILTAYGSLESAVAAIREGVDDYLLKPVEPEELRRAVQAALSRRERLGEVLEPVSRVVTCGKFTIDQKMHQVTLNEHPVELTPREFKLVSYMIRNVNRVVKPSELVEVAQGYQCNDEDEARDIVKWYIYRLRRKVEPDPAHPRYIVNVRGVGYTLCAEGEG